LKKVSRVSRIWLEAARTHGEHFPRIFPDFVSPVLVMFWRGWSAGMLKNLENMVGAAGIEPATSPV
jgi:hypothetical protein